MSLKTSNSILQLHLSKGNVLSESNIAVGRHTCRNHRPHSRQVTGARCTGGRGSPVMSWILLKANNAQQVSGVGDKRFFRFFREQPLYDIMLMILHTNKWCVLISDKDLQIFLKSLWKIPSASGHSRSPFTSCRTRQSWHNGMVMGQWL